MIKSYTDHAANERTFLAWIRTALTIMALGFVIERLDLFLASLAPTGHASIEIGQQEIHVLSVVLVALGIVIIAGSTFGFVRTNRAIEDPAAHPYTGTGVAVTMAAALLLAGLGLLLYLLHVL